MGSYVLNIKPSILNLFLCEYASLSHEKELFCLSSFTSLWDINLCQLVRLVGSQIDQILSD